ncbi:golgin IMH1-like [Pyrus ussuriensis x Pyrus communis]|uniref:Golgin IMH1-like n=1 Tax=Pyrus ussuriensis x Pyrus communis TaxID=2448454 RepID=A0A5N5IEX4_9ROSA|nr:golgin IMH1-like [Pyrus ussuriensis x Pyrus communis]
MIVHEGNNKVRKSKQQRFISQDIDTLSLANLSEALQTYELELRPVKKANKNLALKVIKEEDDDCNEIDPKQLALITRHFQKLLNKPNSEGSGSGTRSSVNKTLKDGSQRFIPKFKARKCYACSGYGYEAKESANTISKQKEEKKALKASYNSWSDSKDCFVAFKNNDEPDDFDEEDVDIEETRERYTNLYLSFDKVKK